jgi:manganese/zinc/iron transport system substrate-binding protein
MVKLKKILSIALCLIPLFFSGCTQTPDFGGPERKKILCTIAQIGNLVSEIGGDRVEVQVLVPGELNPHSYELVKGDDEKIQGADLVFYNGLGLEHGASLSAMIKAYPRGVAVGESIERLHPEKILWSEGTIDPHIWMDISLWAEAVDPMLKEMIAIDPEGREYYSERAAELKTKMMATDKQIFEMIQSIRAEKRFLVTSHDAFQYFAKRYLMEKNEPDWEKRFKAPEGLSPDGQLNPIDIQKIIDHLAFYDIRVLFPESNVSRDSIRKIVDAGKKIGLEIQISSEVLYGDSLKGSYLEGMLHNANSIVRSLSEKENG